MFQQSSAPVFRSILAMSPIPAEIETGNVEYKLKLDPNPLRFQHLVTQLKWRLSEGSGDAIYEVGVSDKGKLVGLGPAELSRSVDTLVRMAADADAEMSVLNRIAVSGRVVLEVLFRSHCEPFPEYRIVVAGAHQAGSTILLN